MSSKIQILSLSYLEVRFGSSDMIRLVSHYNVLFK